MIINIINFLIKFLAIKLKLKSCGVISKFITTESCCNFHFSNYSYSNHPCKLTLEYALGLLNQKPSTIIETGSAAWGTNSTRLFDSYVNSFGGNFQTVDIRLDPYLMLKNECTPRTTFNIQDSVSFLLNWCNSNPDVKIDLLYLDSWDTDWHSPNNSMIHCLKEFLACSRNLKEGSLLLIDDTPINEILMNKVNSNGMVSFQKYFNDNGFYPGKGALVLNLLKSLGRGSLVMHEYQILWKF